MNSSYVHIQRIDLLLLSWIECDSEYHVTRYVRSNMCNKMKLHNCVIVRVINMCMHRDFYLAFLSNHHPPAFMHTHTVYWVCRQVGHHPSVEIEKKMICHCRTENIICNVNIIYALKGSVASQTIHIRTYGYNYKEYSEFSFLTWSIVFADNGIRTNMIKSFEHGVQLSPWNEPIFGISCFLSSLLMMNTSITIRCWYK